MVDFIHYMEFDILDTSNETFWLVIKTIGFLPAWFHNKDEVIFLMLQASIYF